MKGVCLCFQRGIRLSRVKTATLVGIRRQGLPSSETGYEVFRLLRVRAPQPRSLQHSVRTARPRALVRTPTPRAERLSSFRGKERASINRERAHLLVPQLDAAREESTSVHTCRGVRQQNIIISRTEQAGKACQESVRHFDIWHLRIRSPPHHSCTPTPRRGRRGQAMRRTGHKPIP